MAKPIPDGYTAVTPYLIVKDVQAQLDFVGKAFDAIIHVKMQMPNGVIGHCDVSINGAHVMMGQAMIHATLGNWGRAEELSSRAIDLSGRHNLVAQTRRDRQDRAEGQVRPKAECLMPFRRSFLARPVLGEAVAKGCSRRRRRAPPAPSDRTWGARFFAVPSAPFSAARRDRAVDQDSTGHDVDRRGRRGRRVSFSIVFSALFAFSAFDRRIQD